ncbi:hypothetical protein [Enemella dayhoffiae]|nr:hypothetical protein [Enemella dayhoffiae]
MKLLIAAIAVAVVILFAVIAGVTYWVTADRGPAGPPSPPATPATSPAAVTRSPVPEITYRVINRDGGAVSPGMRDQIAVVDAYVRLRYTRTPQAPFPGVDRARLAEISVGQAREAVEAELAAGPDPASYARAQAQGYSQRVSIVDAYLDETGREPIVVNIETRDTNDIGTEGGYQATVSPCGTNLCVATFTRFDTE